ncbi:MerR family transcriptional regulator [Oleiphilus sp. HI0071]|jgi:DNA-binding transcriptional MerR regulator|uniref:MerR family transcriptional regulator n=1 Tax=unclassified Oleiphilus TaxID=2631174 RepID=UPI0007C2BDF2|nr:MULTISPECIES: MerR family DNA-binding transcriptional regulator [unclassified Oleiphilus]KZY69622.1 MerR family transcriptional regulator [Oleiphilus sp. HI0065]KZY87123.1 MerR family transcriptional regulator [Oleiphilus sp. HI0071]KZY91291.1 MerR family transcriptional regulator [Oleiphilus sp. HI0073]KZZ42315.1 MerR family transcriptional regulator [Oleiphilus sp. HI0118]KZZ60238.1 MerR family transcriptional regulator [Oleiphilus sp. HI0122]KZZ64584.1 MerR family transcriptional regula
MERKTYNISELSSEFDITTRTMRFYESEGLLHPTRNGQNRIYDDSDRVRLKLILRGKRLGLSLAESKELINMYSPDGNNEDQLQSLLYKIRERREALAQQLIDIRAMENELMGAEERCLEALKALQTKQ